MIYHLGDHGVDGCDLKAGYIWCHGEYPQERIPLWRRDERTSTTVPMTVPYDKDRSMSGDAIQSMLAQYYWQ